MMSALWAATTTSPSPSPTDLAAGTGTSFQLDAGIVTAIISAMVAIVVAVLTPALQSRQQRRDAVHAKFDAAIAALLVVQGARHYPSDIPGVHYPGTDAQRAEYLRTTVERNVTRFMDLTAEAKTALAEIAQYVPKAHEWITAQWEIREDAEPAMRGAIERERSKAVKAERFLRTRATID